MKLHDLGSTLLLGLLVLGTGVGLGYCASSRSNRDAYVRDSTAMANYRQTIAQLEAQKAKVDTQFKRDTLRLTKWKVDWDSVRALALGLATHDTAPPEIREVIREMVKTADSTIQACGNALTTCEERISLLTDLRRVDSLQIAAQSRELARKYGWLGCSLGPSYSPGQRASWIGATCGLTVKIRLPRLF